MQVAASLVAVLVLVAPGLADDLGQTKKYSKADLPKSITAKTADVVIVVERLKPADVKSIKTTSSNPDIKVRAVEMEGEVRIIITGDKKGDAKVGWGYETVGGQDGGYKDLEIHIE